MGAIGQLAAGIDDAAGIAILVAPAAHDIKVLQREAHRIHDAVAGIAGGILAMPLQPHAHGLGFLARLGLLQRAHARRR